MPTDGTSSLGIRARVAIAFLVIVAAQLVHVGITDLVWEDYLISFRYSQNLAEGHGLVFTEGERVQGFSSPIQVLLPALFHWLFAADTYRPALWGYRVVSMIAFAAGGAGMSRLFLTHRSSSDSLAPLAFVAMLALEIKGLAFATNGMEAGFMVLFLAIGFRAAVEGVSTRWGLAAIAWTGLLYTRADGCVYIAALGITSLLFDGVGRKAVWRGLLLAGLGTAILYLPWFVWSWLYFGTPIPNSVSAKSPAWVLEQVPWLVLSRAVLSRMVQIVGLPFEPIYSRFGGWPLWTLACAWVLGAFSAGYCLLRSSDRVGRMASLLYLFLIVYMSYVDVLSAAVPWYLPPVAVLGMVVLARGTGQMIDRFGSGTPLAVAIQAFRGGAVLTLMFLAVMSLAQLTVFQRVVEYGNREKVGRWLRDAVAAEESVFLEPLGYMGYFSQRRILDASGLVTPRVVALRREQRGLSHMQLIAQLQPDWIVVRPGELEEFQRVSPGWAMRYRLVRTFDVTREIERHRGLYGEPMLSSDSVFLVLKQDDS